MRATRPSAGISNCSAWAPIALPGNATTASPTTNRVTPGPTAAITPAASVSITGFRGPPNPSTGPRSSPKPGGSTPLRTRQSPVVTAVASTRIDTCPGPGTGSGISRCSTTSAGPYLGTYAPFISAPR